MKKYVFITGGELFNKGAQSMTFIVVDEMKKRYPNAEIVLLSTPDFERPDDEKAQYNFTIFPFRSGWIYELIGGGIGKFWDLKNTIKGKRKDEYSEYKEQLDEMLNSAIAIIDVSGYALSSQFRNSRSLNLLLRVLLAQKRQIKMAIMPQSFGPFNYKGRMRFLLQYLMRSTLSYPTKIYAREQEGYDLLKEKFALNNIEKSYDMVLLNKQLNLSNVFKTIPIIPNFEDKKRGIGIVPNKENFRHGKTDEVLALYKNMINHLLEKDQTVYIARHSYDDLEACRTIKSLFQKNENVILIDEELSPMAFDELVNRFNFLIGSRFHSIVHSYKNAVPCIAIGWATKYHELLATFEQSDYIFDVREQIDNHKLLESIDKLLDTHERESKHIQNKLEMIQSVNIFDAIF
jgi:colanic acid/amylovoran biosynthesis protein